MNEPHMVTFELQRRCTCEGVLGGCPKRTTSEIRYIEELVSILKDNPCMTLTKAYPVSEGAVDPADKCGVCGTQISEKFVERKEAWDEECEWYVCPACKPKHVH